MLWNTMLKPKVHSMATQGAAVAAQQATSGAAKASKATGAASRSASATGKKSSGGASSSAGTGSTGTGSGGTAATGSPGTSGAGGSPTTSATPASTTGTPISSSLQSNASPATTYSTVPYAVPANETLDVSDVVLQNPQGDTGELQVRAGSTTLIQLGLANFRNIDYHFAQPIVFTTVAPLVLAVQCQNPGGQACADKLSFSGTLNAGTSSPSPAP